MAKKVLAPPPDEEETGKTQPHNPDNSGFEDMINVVEHDIEEADAEQEIIDRVPELKRLNDNIEKATTTFINAALQLESAIQQYQRAETKLGGSVNTICQKVDTINTHIDNVLKNAPTKLNVAVHASDEDMNAIQNLFEKEVKAVKEHIQKEYRSLNDMLIEERKRTREMFNEYDGIWFGHIGQWFFLFFYYIGIFVVIGVIATAIVNGAGWFK